MAITEAMLRGLWRIGYEGMQAVHAAGLKADGHEGNRPVYRLRTIDAMHTRLRTHADITIPPAFDLFRTLTPAKPSFLTIEDIVAQTGLRNEKILRDIACGRLAAIRLGYQYRIPRLSCLRYQVTLDEEEVLPAQEVANLLGVHVTTIWHNSTGPHAAFERADYLRDMRVVGITQASLMAYLERKLRNCTPVGWIAMRRLHHYEEMLHCKAIQTRYGVHQRTAKRLSQDGGLPCVFSPNDTKPVARIPLHLAEAWATAWRLPITGEDIAKDSGMALADAVTFSLTLGEVWQ